MLFDKSRLKPIVWLGISRQAVNRWSKNTRRKIGHELQRLQERREPLDWKPMSTIGIGVREIRVSDEGNQYRVMYFAGFEEAIYVLHTFEKRTQKTRKHDVDLAMKRFKVMQVSRGNR